MEQVSCRICQNQQHNRLHTVREMMFGYRNTFRYLECGSCGCLQLVEQPDDLAKYYPEDYYSYQGRSEDVIIQRSVSKTVKRRLKAWLLDYYLQGNSVAGKLLHAKFSGYYPWIRHNMLTSHSRILDVGCGSGELLLRMYNDGFRDLTGIDPYIPEDIRYSCGITIHKQELTDLQGTFDCIMLHHAFEHMDHPADVLRTINHLLSDNGIVLIRIPVADSFAWKKYGVNWVQLDAPRHFYLHTRQSMQFLCAQSSFVIEEIMHDSWHLQFSGSERYCRDIPLVDKTPLFTDEEIRRFSQEAIVLNQKGEGDAACFFLRKSSMAAAHN